MIAKMLSSVAQLPPRRVLLASASSGSQGGGELYMDFLAEGLHRAGHEVHSYLAAHPRMNDLAKLLGRWGGVHRSECLTNTYDRRFRSLSTVITGRARRRIAAELGSLRPDVIHINKQNLEDGLDLLQAGNITQIPYVCDIHVTRTMADLGSAFGGMRDWLTRRVLQASRGEYIATAAACHSQLSKFVRGVIKRDRIHLVLNGIRIAPPGDRAAIRAGWRCVPSDIVVGCVARLEAQKDPLFALDLLARLPANVRLVWVGDGRLRGMFEQRINELGLAGRVHLDGWRNDARQRMTGFDIFLLPSLYEGFPFAVLEAMAAGLPCVASDVDGTREAVDNGVTGWLCPSRAQVEWLSRLNELVADPEQRVRMGEAGRRRVEESFSLDSMARGTAAVYEVAIRRAATLVGDR
jgi:glycosyltransferase involved in cell wall biosynthesis